jgi:hypothetical protein
LNRILIPHAGCGFTFTPTVQTDPEPEIEKGSLMHIVRDAAGARMIINNPGQRSYTMQILNTTGSIMEQITVQPGRYEKQLTEYAPGIYLYRIIENQRMKETGKLILH